MTRVASQTEPRTAVPTAGRMAAKMIGETVVNWTAVTTGAMGITAGDGMTIGDDGAVGTIGAGIAGETPDAPTFGGVRIVE